MRIRSCSVLLICDGRDIFGDVYVSSLTSLFPLGVGASHNLGTSGFPDVEKIIGVCANVVLVPALSDVGKPFCV